MTSVLVTGAGGYLGRALVRALAEEGSGFASVVATDTSEPTPERRVPGVRYERYDVRTEALPELLERHGVEAVVHLAAVVSPRPGTPREGLYDVDVRGTERVLRACLAAGVAQLVTVSSGAAYGYHADAPPLLDEEAPLRGNECFAYAHHKRLVEELLARARDEHPALRQLVLRPGTILGPGARNQITDLFTAPLVVGLAGRDTPFVFVAAHDVVRAIVEGVRARWHGVYNLAGEGALTLREIAARMARPYVAVPERAVQRGVGLLAAVGATRYGPEQTAFLAHRPVLSSARLQRERGLRLAASREVFERWRRSLWRGRPGPSPVCEAVVVVTGAAGGIGHATARRFAELGARVALLDRDGALVEERAAALRAEGFDARGLACDVTDEDVCEAALARVEGALGGVDVLVNNAGISHRSLLEHTDGEVLRRVMEVNYFGAVHCTRAALPSLLARRGAVVAVSSVAGFAPLVGRTGYAASKHALHGFFGSLREEVAHRGVGVSLVCPSYTRTGIDAAALDGAGGRAGEGKAVVGALASPEHVAEAIVEAAIDRAREVLPTRTAWQARWLSKLAPGAYGAAMRAAQGAEFGLPAGRGRR